jgi:hypothetical protein
MIRRMPKVNGAAWKSLVAEADWSPEHMADLLNLTTGAYRNVTAGREPTTDRKIYRAARALSAQLRREVTYQDLIAEEGDGVPDEPPDQPQNPTKPRRRKERSGNGPKRDHRERGAA